MRTAFIRELTRICENDDRVVLITADMGFSVFDAFAEQFPDRFFNVGIAESTMVGVAAGLAMQGYKPVIYSIVPFATMRCFEQLRIDVCYQNLPVIVVGVGGGLSYGALGSTHHAIEDVSIMRAVPNMSVYVPGDPLETVAVLRLALEYGRPAYIRLGKNNEPQVHSEAINAEDGMIALRRGVTIAVVCSGPLIAQALQLSDRLEAIGKSVSVFSMLRIKPLPVETLKEVCISHTVLVTIEEATLVGGASAAIAEWILDSAVHPVPRLIRFGIPDAFPGAYGSHQFLLHLFGLDADSMFTKLAPILEGAV